MFLAWQEMCIRDSNEDLPRGPGGRNADPCRFRQGQHLQIRVVIDIILVHLGVPRMGHVEHLVEPPQQRLSLIHI